MKNQEEYLSYEKLLVWEKAVDFAIHALEVIEKISPERKHFKIVEQMEACSTSVSMNIAEGKGRWSQKEFKQFLYYSRGSLYETLTLMKILDRKSWIPNNEYISLRKEGLEINKMLNSLISKLKTSIAK